MNIIYLSHNLRLLIYTQNFSGTKASWNDEGVVVEVEQGGQGKCSSSRDSTTLHHGVSGRGDSVDIYVGIMVGIKVGI